MGNGWHEWPLVLFTVLGQCVAGALVVSGLGWLAEKNDPPARQRIVRGMFFLWVVMGLGFLASIMHLGSPMRAFNSLNRVGASGLSNEIAAGSIFFAVGGFWWLVAVLGKMPETLGKLWLLISMVLGIIFILAMTRVYQIETVPTWYTGYTTLAFFLTAFLGGPLFAALLFQASRVPFNSTIFSSISLLALLVCIAGLPCGTSCHRPGLLDLPIGTSQRATYCWVTTGAYPGAWRRNFRPRPVLWATYDCRYGSGRLTN